MTFTDNARGAVPVQHPKTHLVQEQDSPPSVPAEAPRAAAPAKRPRLYVLDGLRLIAALGVLAWHWLGVERFPDIWHGSPSKLMPLGHLVGAYSWTGVELFFLISGFVICMSCWGRSVGDFVTSRVVRLFPAYWVCVLLTAGVLLVVPKIWGDNTHRPTPTRILTNLTMTNMPLGVDNIDPVYWTLWAELRFYILFGVMVAIGLTYRRVLAFCGIWGFMALIAGSVDMPLLVTIFQPTYAWFFIGGITIYLMYRFGQNLLLWGMLGFCWLISQDQMRGVIGGYEYGTRHHLSWGITVGITTLAFAVVAASGLGAFNWMRWKWLTVAGALTYPLYLLHQVIGWQLITRISRHLDPYPTLATVTALMMLAAWLVHRLIERPLAPFLKRHMEAAFRQVRAAGSAPTGGGRKG
ncbi:acyltransferase family protein [Kitasatospora sp. NBC_01539]|uniref:acyltransferase family protein n=1 Tax=Kitasatospora sp. NBC_01539 TaxID=2903577 RepID=UPI0038600EF7